MKDFSDYIKVNSRYIIINIGFWPDLVRFVPGYAVYFLAFYRVRKYLENKKDKTPLRLFKLFISGGIAGITFIYIYIYRFNPVDSVIPNRHSQEYNPM